jgi:hypothetical protein
MVRPEGRLSAVHPVSVMPPADISCEYAVPAVPLGSVRGEIEMSSGAEPSCSVPAPLNAICLPTTPTTLLRSVWVVPDPLAASVTVDVGA